MMRDKDSWIELSWSTSLLRVGGWGPEAEETRRALLSLRS